MAPVDCISRGPLPPLCRHHWRPHRRVRVLRRGRSAARSDARHGQPDQNRLSAELLAAADRTRRWRARRPSRPARRSTGFKCSSRDRSRRSMSIWADRTAAKTDGWYSTHTRARSSERRPTSTSRSFTVSTAAKPSATAGWSSRCCGARRWRRVLASSYLIAKTSSTGGGPAETSSSGESKPIMCA